MSSKTSNLTITIPSSFIKQLYFLFHSFSFSFISPCFFPQPSVFFFFSFLLSFLPLGRIQLQPKLRRQLSSSLHFSAFFFFFFSHLSSSWPDPTPIGASSTAFFLSALLSFFFPPQLSSFLPLGRIHSQSVDEAPALLSSDPLHLIDDDCKPFLASVNGNLTFPSSPLRCCSPFEEESEK
jgi:hypothetical protein